MSVQKVRHSLADLLAQFGSLAEQNDAVCAEQVSAAPRMSSCKFLFVAVILVGAVRAAVGL